MTKKKRQYKLDTNGEHQELKEFEVLDKKGVKELSSFFTFSIEDSEEFNIGKI